MITNNLSLLKKMVINQKTDSQQVTHDDDGIPSGIRHIS